MSISVSQPFQVPEAHDSKTVLKPSFINEPIMLPLKRAGIDLAFDHIVELKKRMLREKLLISTFRRFFIPNVTKMVHPYLIFLHFS